MLAQEQIKDIMLPILEKQGRLYEKFLPITARKAKEKEVIQTITSDGLETENIAEVGDFIVQNQTKAGEEYIISKETFNKRYEFLEEIDENQSRYKPIGKAIGVEMTSDLAQKLSFKLPFHFTASWGSAMVVKENDFLVCPPDYRSVYRIARKEFFETYRLSK